MAAETEPSGSNDADDVRGVRRVATGILIFLTLVFAASFSVSEPPFWLLLVRAMAEAGMVGGLADWFAVEALFRHPLKLPIPHTALLPKNQKRAAGNIAKFIDEYFLVPSQLIGQAKKLNPVKQLAGWLSRTENAKLVAFELSHFLRVILKHQLERGIGVGANKVIRDLLVLSVNPKGLSGNITLLLKDAVKSHLLDDILFEVRKVLDENREKVTAVVQDRSRWWIASSVDQKVVQVLVDGMLSVIDELSNDKSSLRHDFDRSIVHLVEGLHTSGRISRYIDEEREHFADSEEFAVSVDQAIASVLEKIEQGLEEAPNQAADLIANALKDFAQSLLEQPELERQLNQRLFDGMETILIQVRPAIVEYITHVIEAWDSEELVERMENEVGRDLQFIRINGAVLGALVGGVLFLVTQAYH